jgi:hypothetical protein
MLFNYEVICDYYLIKRETSKIVVNLFCYFVIFVIL